ncbi:MAG TPA: DUF2946 family protein [Burkholderiaceae bacterium]|nr:DUF2946 family protein [Burkholderiaceae bacterium]
MDDLVKAAMARWPNVPDIFGWLSLSEQGQWLLHPEGSASSEAVTISHSNTIAFINRNYQSDAEGRWFFQNGPQRVFVRLLAAPYILRTTVPGSELGLETHNGLAVKHPQNWLTDDTGRLFVTTEHGPALVAGRDAFQVFEALPNFLNHSPAELPSYPSRDIPRQLNFVSNPN